MDIDAVKTASQHRWGDKEIKNLKLKLENLEMRNESLTNRIRILEEDFERLKKAQLERYFEYSTAEESTEENEIYKECNNSDCSECEKYKYY